MSSTHSLAFFAVQSPVRWLFPLHILGGTVALATLLFPLVSKKGSRTHIRSGWVYVAAMTVIGLSAYVITPWRGLFDPERSASSQAFAAFLFFIATLTLSSISYGLRAIRHKARSGPVTGPLELGPPLVLIVAALAVEAIGLAAHQTLLIVFPVLGVLTGWEQLRYWRNPPAEKMHWWYAHMSGMGTASIATITAFLVTAVPRLTDQAWFRSPVLWIAPGVVLGTLLNRWAESYRARFEKPRAVSP
jgi:hypothetical protein